MPTFSLKSAKDFHYPRRFSDQFPEEVPYWSGLVRGLRVLMMATWLWLLPFRHGFSFSSCSFYPIYFSPLFHFSPLYFTANAKAVILLYVCQGHNGTEIFL